MKKIDKTDTLEVVLTRGRFEVDYYQREYRWGRRQIEQMLMDFYDTFQKYYDPEHHVSTREVQNYGYYYMGSIICTGGTTRKIVDGQQRLTSLTLLLMYLQNLQNQTEGVPTLPIDFKSLIYRDDFGTMAFNIDVAERNSCMEALWHQNRAYVPLGESNKNLMQRYADIEELFPDELKGEALPYFIYWLKGKVLFLEIDTPSEDEAHTIFLTMNDRGLSLNSAEMLKAFMIQQVDEGSRDAVNQVWQQNIDRIKRTFDGESSGAVRSEDVDFISAWLRAKYAKTIRDTKRGAEDQDFELLGEKFHTWVRKNARTKMQLTQPRQYKEMVTVEMSQMMHLYLRIREYSQTITKGYEAVFYNTHRNITYQNYLVMAAVCVDDPPEVVDQKIKMIATFIDVFASARIFNYKKINWNTNKTLLFRIMCQIRNQDVKTVGIRLTAALQRMPEKFDAIADFVLNRFTDRYMLHMLARFTDYVNLRMGYASQFAAYIDRNPRISYDVEHILADDYETYKALFNDEEDFRNSRQKIGNLMLLTLDHNRSYQDMPYAEKVVHYLSDNILAQALNSNAYVNNPQFLALQDEFGFRPHDIQFDKEAIRERTQMYIKLAKAIWNPETIRTLAGDWDDDLALTIQSGSGRRFTVEYSNGRSWEDARAKGFVSAAAATLGANKLTNVHVGDFVFCHIQGRGFVGVGICESPAVLSSDFLVEEDGATKPVLDCRWINEAAKAELDAQRECFLGVKWLRTVCVEDGYWERGMTSVPAVAYLMNDGTTHNKVLKHFRITLN